MGLDGPEAGRLIAQGLVIGVIHVLTGPDHMTAIAAITAGVPWYTSFFSGLRWGAGHSTGLLIVTIAFLSAGGSADLEEIGRYCEWVVGVVMILLGLWTLRSALKSKPPTDMPPSTQDTGDVASFHASPSSSLGEPLLTHHHHHHGSSSGGISGVGGSNGGGLDGGLGVSEGTHTSSTPTRHHPQTPTTVGDTVTRMIAREYGLDTQKDHSKDLIKGVGGGGGDDGNNHHRTSDKGTHGGGGGGGTADHGGVGGVNNLHTIAPAVPSPLPQSMPYAQAPYTYYTTTLPEQQQHQHQKAVQQQQQPPQPQVYAGTSTTYSLPQTRQEDGHLPASAVYHAHQRPQRSNGEEDFGQHAEAKDESCDTTHAHAPHSHTKGEGSSSRWRAMKERLVAFVVGTVHGIAGPGGVLGVLPAVQLHDWGKAMLYLCTFCLSSMCVMGVFAAVYGDLTHRAGQLVMGRLTYYLKIFSACLSMLVGVVWIVLSALGTLDQVFG